MADHLKSFRQALKKAIEELSSPESMRMIGEEASKIIKKRTRLGWGSRGETKEKLAPLSEKYIKRRKSLSLHYQTTAKRSNLTATGQMLDSLKPLSVSDGKAQIGPDGNRSDSELTNLEVAQFASITRPFMPLTKLEIKQLEQFISLLLKKKLGDFFK